MTRQSREIALAVAATWRLLSEAGQGAQPGSVEQSRFRVDEGLIERVLDHRAEAANVDSGDLVSDEEVARLVDEIAGAALRWEQRDHLSREQNA